MSDIEDGYYRDDRPMTVGDARLLRTVVFRGMLLVSYAVLLVGAVVMMHLDAHAETTVLVLGAAVVWLYAAAYNDGLPRKLLSKLPVVDGPTMPSIDGQEIGKTSAERTEVAD